MSLCLPSESHTAALPIRDVYKRLDSEKVLFWSKSRYIWAHEVCVFSRKFNFDLELFDITRLAQEDISHSKSWRNLGMTKILSSYSQLRKIANRSLSIR